MLWEPDAAGVWRTVAVEARIALGRCRRCGGRWRVLPVEALPRKIYSLGVIAQAASEYAPGERSLRDVAWNLAGERLPSHTTLHGWTEGLGAYALGRPAGEAGGEPWSRFLAEAEGREPAVGAIWAGKLDVDPRRYRSEERRERLEAGKRVLAVADGLAAGSLVECRRLALSWSRSCVLLFPSRIRDTPGEHLARSASPDSPRSPAGDADRCPTASRSPPGASSESPP